MTLKKKGVCPAGGAHHEQGFVFVLPHIDPDTVTFDTGPLKSDLPLGGSAHIVMRRDGNFTFSCHAHDSGFNNIHYVVSAVVMTPSRIAFTFQHRGGVEGTSAGLPFGTPRRDDNFITSGHNQMITDEFSGLLDGAVLKAGINGEDQLKNGLKGLVEDLVKKTGR